MEKRTAHTDVINPRRLPLWLFLCLLISCRKDVTLDLPDYKQKVVIEAAIETGSPAVVFLSWSVPYFGTFDFSDPGKAFIKGATVVIDDGQRAETLQEIDPGTGYLYLGAQIIGAEGRTYAIRVTVNGKTYETTTTILKPVPLDTLYFKSEHDSLGHMWQMLSEPAGSGDCYRWYAKRLGRDLFYAAPFNSVFDDKFIDGATFEFGYDRGAQPYQTQQNRGDEERGYYKKGDTVVVKFCKIGRREYEFWNTYYQNKISNGNPFSSPANIKSMFNEYEEAFGSFVGYAVSYDTLVIPVN